MRTLVFATMALSMLGSGAAFADATQIGDANQAPVFATVSGDTSAVIDVGNASQAPVFGQVSGNAATVTEIGNANHAPVFTVIGGDAVAK